MSFNEEASIFSGNDVSPCYSQRLALAVPVNKRALSKYVDELIGTGKRLCSSSSSKQKGFEQVCR